MARNKVNATQKSYAASYDKKVRGSTLSEENSVYILQPRNILKRIIVTWKEPHKLPRNPVLDIKLL